jgi:L-ascorbate metabolism protein UlaG (beta-lactamase superfamily)
MTECIDHAAGRTHMPGVSDQLYVVMAEQYAVELLEALKAAVAGAAHWRPEAQSLLRLIAECRLPEEPRS